MTTELEPRPAMASNGAQSSSVAWTAQTRTSVRVEHADSEQRPCPCGIDHGGSIGCCKLHCARPRMAAREAPAWRGRMHTSNCGTARAASVATRGIRFRAPIRRCAHRLTGEAGARSGHAPGVVENICTDLHYLGHVTLPAATQRDAAVVRASSSKFALLDGIVASCRNAVVKYARRLDDAAPQKSPVVDRAWRQGVVGRVRARCVAYQRMPSNGLKLVLPFTLSR
ncbi:hypothetical protein FHR49_003873 [Xanthomonas campestris]